MRGHHVYKDLWTPTIGEKFEPNNIKGYHAVCVQKDGVMVGHLMLGKTGRFAKIIFYFLGGHTHSKSCHVSCVGKDKRLFLLEKELVG